jgi:hypothetical protein
MGGRDGRGSTRHHYGRYGIGKEKRDRQTARKEDRKKGEEIALAHPVIHVARSEQSAACLGHYRGLVGRLCARHFIPNAVFDPVAALDACAVHVHVGRDAISRGFLGHRCLFCAVV